MVLWNFCSAEVIYAVVFEIWLFSVITNVVVLSSSEKRQITSHYFRHVYMHRFVIVWNVTELLFFVQKKQIKRQSQPVGQKHQLDLFQTSFVDRMYLLCQFLFKIKPPRQSMINFGTRGWAHTRSYQLTKFTYISESSTHFHKSPNVTTGKSKIPAILRIPRIAAILILRKTWAEPNLGFQIFVYKSWIIKLFF